MSPTSKDAVIIHQVIHSAVPVQPELNASRHVGNTLTCTLWKCQMDIAKKGDVINIHSIFYSESRKILDLLVDAIQTAANSKVVKKVYIADVDLRLGHVCKASVVTLSSFISFLVESGV